MIATVVIISFLPGWTSGLTGLFIDYFDQSSVTFRFAAQILVLLGLAAANATVGKFSKSRTAMRTLGSFGKIMKIVPVYRSLYHGIKHLANSLADNKSS